MLMEKLVSDAKEQKRKGYILTCKNTLIPYYAKFGFKDCGLSESVHGGAVWYDIQREQRKNTVPVMELFSKQQKRIKQNRKNKISLHKTGVFHAEYRKNNTCYRLY
jgi:hypothetical protein